MKDYTKLAELSIEIGPAPITVSSMTRNPVRKWIIANGSNYAAVQNLTVAELSRLYNDEDALAAFLAVQTPEPQPSPEPQPEKPQAMQSQPQATPPATSAQAAALQALLATLTPQTAPLDEARIVELIAEHCPKSPITTVRLASIPKGEIRELPAAMRHEVFPLALALVDLDNLWLAGPAGSGKTTIAEQIAEALEIPFFFTGAVSSEYKLTGFIDAQGRTVKTAFRAAFEDGGLFLFDEIDASAPAALLAFNAALSNGQFDFPDGTVKRHPSFRCIASANTWGSGASREYVGRNQLDAASLDRFAKIEMDYDHALERLIASSFIAPKISDRVADYVQAVRLAARESSVRQVISPRATSRVCKMLQAGLALPVAMQAGLYTGWDTDTKSRIQNAGPVDQAAHSLAVALDAFRRVIAA